jgi:hypothetical protein
VGAVDTRPVSLRDFLVIIPGSVFLIVCTKLACDWLESRERKTEQGGHKNAASTIMAPSALRRRIRT